MKNASIDVHPELFVKVLRALRKRGLLNEIGLVAH